MILVTSGAFLSISSWFCELTVLIFVMIPYISSTGYPPKTQGIMGHVQVANIVFWRFSWCLSRQFAEFLVRSRRSKSQTLKFPGDFLPFCLLSLA